MKFKLGDVVISLVNSFEVQKGEVYVVERYNVFSSNMLVLLDKNRKRLLDHYYEKDFRYTKISARFYGKTLN